MNELEIHKILGSTHNEDNKQSNIKTDKQHGPHQTTGVNSGASEE